VPGVKMTFQGLQVERRLSRLAEGEARDAAYDEMDDVARLLSAEIKRNASGRPGPNAPTGDYRRSWRSSRSGGGANVRWRVSTNRPQGPRLEYGFYGVDSLGRVYRQPAFPHVAPAVAKIEPVLYERVQAALDGLQL
jgi:hypothetical protein